jgi:hypothetical protein
LDNMLFIIGLILSDFYFHDLRAEHALQRARGPCAPLKEMVGPRGSG